MRLIDADATYKMAKDDKRYSAFHYRKADLGDLYYLVLVDSPTIEAEPVRHRTWVIKTHDDGYGAYQVKHCPDCDRGLPVEYDADYCPNCGAKMDGKENKE